MTPSGVEWRDGIVAGRGGRVPWTRHTEYMKARILLMVAACLVTISMSMHLTAQSGQASAQTSRAPGVDGAHALG